MKLNQMTTDQAADVLIRIADPAAEIMNDAEFDKLLNGITAMKNPTEAQQLSFLVFKLLPFLIKHHRNAVYTVLSIMTDKPEEVLAEQLITETAKDVRDSVDHDLIDFFLYSRGQTPKGETE